MSMASVPLGAVHVVSSGDRCGCNECVLLAAAKSKSFAKKIGVSSDSRLWQLQGGDEQLVFGLIQDRTLVVSVTA